MGTEAGSAEIRDVALYRFVDPSSATAGACRLVVRLQAGSGVEGLGEVTVPSRSAARVWDALRHAAPTVIGRTAGRAPDRGRAGGGVGRAGGEVGRAVRRAYEQAMRDLAGGAREGGGNGRAVDLGALAAWADRVAEFPPAETAADRPNEYPEYAAEVGTGDSRTSMLLETELLRAGLRTSRLSSKLVLAGPPGSDTSIGFYRTRSSGISVPGSTITGHKGVTREVLAARGLPVAPGAHFPAGAGDQAYEAGLALGFPLVLKPGGGTKGIGVTTGITTAAALREAIEQVERSPYARSGLVVERFVTGDDYRVLATDERVLSVVHRQRASVVGDGRHTIEELVIAANALRRRNPNLGKLPIALHTRTDNLLRSQGFSSRSVPAAGQRVWLSEVANLSQGGESYEVTDSTHESILALAVKAVQAIPGLRYAGLDILLADHTAPADAQELTIVEVNSVPMLNMHHFPMYGPSREVAATLVAGLARDAGMCTGPRAESELTVRFAASGSVPRLGYRWWLHRVARGLQVRCRRVRTGPGHIEATLTGQPAQVGRLLRRAFDGPRAASIERLVAEPVTVAAAPAAPVPPREVPLPADPVIRPGRPVTTLEPVGRARRRGARLLATVAGQQGYEVRSLDYQVVLCQRDGQVLAFRGLAGPSMSTVATQLCGDLAMLRQHLSAMDLPVATGEIPALAELAVVGGRLVGLACSRPEQADARSWGALAVAAVRALPGAAYGAVTLAAGGGGLGIAAIDPWFGRWCGRDDPAASAVAAAILQFEHARRAR